jgi:uncharacterized membrane protein
MKRNKILFACLCFAVFLYSMIRFFLLGGYETLYLLLYLFLGIVIFVFFGFLFFSKEKIQMKLSKKINPSKAFDIFLNILSWICFFLSACFFLLVGGNF